MLLFDNVYLDDDFELEANFVDKAKVKEILINGKYFENDEGGVTYTLNEYEIDIKIQPNPYKIFVTRYTEKH